MGVVRDKMDYLSGTKRLLREAINAVLADRGDPLLTESDPFEDYPSALYAGSPTPSAGSLTGSAADKLLRLNETKSRLREAINVELSSRGEPLLTDAEAFRLYSSRLFFTPLELFANDEQGAWYDPSDLTTLYQDSAGTTPVTADGDPVGLMMDKSGNGNHASQGTSAARPIYRTDGVLHWLEPDGVDDSLITPAVDLSPYTKLTASFGLRKLSDTQGVSPVIMSGVTGNTAGGFSLYAPHSNAARKVAWSLGGSSQRFRSIDAFPAPMSIVQSALFDNVAASLADAVIPRLNGSEVIPTEDVSGSASGSGFRNDVLRLFVQEPTSNFSKNPFYGGVLVTGHLPVNDLSALENYIAQKSGVQL